MKSRQKSNEIRKVAEGALGRILVLTGARQTGKTTLVKELFPQHSYVSIEDPILRNDLLKLIASQWNELFPHAVLDEVQKAPTIIESIKSVVDQFNDTSHILLGSSQLLLLQKVKESLAGRCSIIELYPLTIPELLTNNWEEPPKLSNFQTMLSSSTLPSLPPSFHLCANYSKKQEAYDSYLTWGGYPVLHKGTLNNEEKERWLRNYVRTYLERDIRDLADLRNLEPFIRVQQTSALLTGQTINFSSLARNASIHTNTAQRFMQYMEMSYQTILLAPWHRNPLKRLSKMSKLHYLDPGIQQIVASKKISAINGHAFESAIIAEMYKQAKNISNSFSFYHLRTVDGREVDFLIETNVGYYAFEIKQSQVAHKTDARGLIGLQEILDKPLLHSYILSNDMQTKSITPEITALHAGLFLS